MFKQYQEVELTHDMMSDDLLGEIVPMHRGQRGVIVAIHKVVGVPTGYDVEFFDDDGETVAVMIVLKNDIKPLTEEPPKSKRRASKSKSHPRVA